MAVKAAEDVAESRHVHSTLDLQGSAQGPDDEHVIAAASARTEGALLA
jgi:hypothetical protein